MSDSLNKKDNNNGSWGLPEGMDPMKVMQVASGYWQVYCKRLIVWIFSICLMARPKI